MAAMYISTRMTIEVSSEEFRLIQTALRCVLTEDDKVAAKELQESLMLQRAKILRDNLAAVEKHEQNILEARKGK